MLRPTFFLAFQFSVLLARDIKLIFYLFVPQDPSARLYPLSLSSYANMVPKNTGAKPRRQKKNKSRTEGKALPLRKMRGRKANGRTVSDGSDSEIEIEKQSSPIASEKKEIVKKSTSRSKAASPSPSSSSSSASSTPEPNVRPLAFPPSSFPSPYLILLSLSLLYKELTLPDTKTQIRHRDPAPLHVILPLTSHQGI